MKKDCVIKLPVRYATVPARKVTPFHWALLHALRTFPAGSRPPLSEFARRLGLDDSGFLDKAWSDLRELQIADDDDFALGGLTNEGRQALDEGWFHLGPAVERSGFLFLNPSDGSGAPARPPADAPSQALSERPDWMADIGMGTLAASLLRQAPPKRGERVVSLRPLWEKAELVSLRTPKRDDAPRA